MSTPILTVNHVSFDYPNGNTALFDVNLTIPKGTRVALLGPNGAGKSTLLLLFNGIFRPTQGSLALDGKKNVYNKQGITELRQRIGFVFQDHDSQLFAGTVLDDVIFGPMNVGKNLAEAEEIAKQVLEEVGMGEYINSPIHFLSHGQKKRIAIAGVLAMEPDIIVMDEPTAGLDYLGTNGLSSIMERLYQQGKTLVASTHDMEWAWSWADMIVVINKGRLVAIGTPEEILTTNTYQKFGYGKSILGTIYSFIQCKTVNRIKERPRTIDELLVFLEEQ